MNTYVNEKPSQRPLEEEGEMTKEAPVKIPDGPVNEATRRYRDILEVARLVSWCTNWEYLIKTCLEHISQRLEARARCAILEGDDLKLCYWVGKYEYPPEKINVCKESIVWEVFRKGEALNLTDLKMIKRYKHTLKERVKIKAIIPLFYIDPLCQIEKKIGVLIIDFGAKGIPVSRDDFEYLKVIADLIGSAVGRNFLVEELIESYREREAVMSETTHNFRNSVAVIGGFSRRIAQMAADSDLAAEADILYRETGVLEKHIEEFEKQLDVQRKDFQERIYNGCSVSSALKN